MGSKPAYGGPKHNLIPFLTCLEIRQKNEGYAPKTFITKQAKTYDFTQDSTAVAKD
jgi:hypothetical protein